MRCFIALDISGQAKDEIERIQKQIPEFLGKLTERENLHLTFKFLGEISDEKFEEAKKNLKKIKFKSFDAKLGFLGVFSEDAVRIVWIWLENCDELQKEIDEKLKDVFPKEKRFMSHLTIARVKNVEHKERFLKQLRNIRVNPITFKVRGFSLKQSTLTKDGPVYEDLVKVKLV